MSFIQTYLDLHRPSEKLDDWWLHEDVQAYQFIGEDNIYFYDLAGMGLFMALNEAAGRDRNANLPIVIPSRHLLYGNTKAASSGKLTPPTARELLDHYTAEQLRMHFGHMATHSNSVKFLPKSVFRKMYEGKEVPKEIGEIEGFDLTLAEGNLLTNVFNRLARSCFYTLQQYEIGTLAEVSTEVAAACSTLIDDYEFAMYRFEFPKAVDMLDKFLRDANKNFDAKMKEAKANDDHDLRAQALADAFHNVKTAAALLNPFAPDGTERLREYFNVSDAIWSWDNIKKPLDYFICQETATQFPAECKKENTHEARFSGEGHKFKFLEPRVDFFLKHEAQL